MSLGRKPLPPRRDRSDEFASFKPAPTTARMATRDDITRTKIGGPSDWPFPTGEVARIYRKTPQRKQQAIRDSANGEQCTVRLAGVCNHNAETTVWSHAPFEAAGKGGAMKGLDLLGCYCCSACHAVVDGHAPRPPGMSRELVLLDWFYGMCRSLVRLRQKGLV